MRPPIFHIARIPHAALYPLSYQELITHPLQAATKSSPNNLHRLSRGEEKTCTPEGVESMLKELNIPVGSDAEWRLSDPFSVSVMDYFGESPHTQSR